MPFSRHLMISMENKMFDVLISEALSLGAYRANIIETKEISLDIAFREICASNACGMYGKCWMCPPDVGDIDVLMNEVGKYDYALIYQTVTDLEDSYDFEGMIAAKKHFHKLEQGLREFFDKFKLLKTLHLGVGGCGLCESCTKRMNKPCRFSEKAISSLEAYGINVAKLAVSAGMKYVNGQNTVTYFGAVLFSLQGED